MNEAVEGDPKEMSEEQIADALIIIGRDNWADRARAAEALAAYLKRLEACLSSSTDEASQV